MENILLIGLVILLAVFAVYRLFFRKGKELPSSGQADELDGEEYEETTIDTLIEDIKEIFGERLRTNVLDENLTKDQMLRKKRDLNKLREELNRACMGDEKSRRGLKGRINTILTSREYGYCLTTNAALDSIIHFNNIRLLSTREIHEIIVHLYAKKYGENGFEQFINDFNLTMPVPGDDGRLYYKVTEERIRDAIADICEGRSSLGDVRLTESDKLEIITQQIYSQYQGFDCIDSLYYQHLDEIDCGISGIPVGGFNIAAASKGNGVIKYSYESVWVVYRGLNINLEYLSFKNAQEYVRVCDNIYRFNATEILSQSTPYSISTMPDGSRIAEVRPPAAENWAFFLRKFSTPDKIPVFSELYRDAYNYIPIALIKWCIKGEFNVMITGTANTGKTTAMKAAIKFMDPARNIRVIEKSFELSLRFMYTGLNLLTVQETAGMSIEAISDWMKKANSAITILGEVADAESMGQYIEKSQVNSRQNLGTHHAGTTEELIESAAGNLTRIGQYRDKNDAMAAVARAININIHIDINNRGERYISFIDEIIPYENVQFPSETPEYEKSSEMDRTLADARKYFHDMVSPKKYIVNRLCHWTEEGGYPHYVFDNMPTEERFYRHIKQRFPDEFTAEYENDMRNLYGACGDPNTEEAMEWIQKILTA